MGKYTIDSKEPDVITYDDILYYISELDIYRYYIDDNLELNKPISSPLRVDNNPSWSLYVSKSGQIMWKDFGTSKSGNVITFVREIFNLTHKSAINKIYDDLVRNKGLRKSNSKKPNVSNYEKKRIIVNKRRWSNTDTKYWKQYFLTREDLYKFNAYPIITYWIKANGEYKQSPYFYADNDPMYAYRVFNSYKIYRPLQSKKYKWRTNMSNYDIFGFEQLPHKGRRLIITKSLKDIMVLNKLGYNAISPQSEGVDIPKEIIDNLKFRFKYIYILYDNDEQGINSSKQLAKKYNLVRLELGTIEKDISDYVKAHGIKDAKKLIKKCLEEKNVK